MQKLINFTDEQIKQIEEFSSKFSINFTESVRRLIELGLKAQEKITENGEKENLLQELQEKIEKLSWWTCDDNTSKLTDLESTMNDVIKKVNILTALSKKFKGHLEDRSIHLQD